MRITLIAALADNGVIGLDGGMPWRLPADLKHFKRSTLGKPLIMGRRTFDSLGKPLPGRTSIVVSRQPGLEIEGCVVVAEPEAALQAAEASGADEVMVVGGAEIYAQLLPRAERLLLTHVHAEIDGDTRFPELDLSGWRELERRERLADARNPHDLSFVTYARRS